MSLKVYVANRQVRIPLEQLRAQLPPTVELLDGDTPPSVDYDVIVAAFPSRETLEQSPNVRAVITPFAGTPKETIELLRDYPLISLHSLHYNVNTTAEMAIGLMIAAARSMLPLDRALRNHDWRARYTDAPALILDKRLVTIVGYGRIGKRRGDSSLVHTSTPVGCHSTRVDGLPLRAQQLGNIGIGRLVHDTDTSVRTHMSEVWL